MASLYIFFALLADKTVWVCIDLRSNAAVFLQTVNAEQQVGDESAAVVLVAFAFFFQSAAAQTEFVHIVAMTGYFYITAL